jgi:hypothetical protein
MYKPNPVDTSDVVLSPDVMALGEAMAKNIHDVWAARRILEGWTYGEIRSDRNKTHPGLVPYEELSEAEKDYDRQTALETLRLMVKLGYRIVNEHGSVTITETTCSEPYTD